MAMVGVLVPSFSLREEEPNPCNRRLAAETIRFCEELAAKGHVPVVVLQWEVDLAFRMLDDVEVRTSPDPVRQVEAGEGVFVYGGSVGQLDDGRYLGTKEVYEEARAIFKEYECTHIAVVAQPFIHQPYTYWLARKDFKLIWKRTRWIGFDKESLQWWCRSWYQFAWQTLRLAAGVKHGYNGRQEL